MDRIFKKNFKQLIGISGYHHFVFTQESPGVVLVKKRIDSEVKIIDISKNLIAEPELEPKFPVDLTVERRNYLSEEISKFVQNPIKKDFLIFKII